MRLFRLDSPIMQGLTKLGNIMWINLLWLLCCIPIVTIGASTAALYRMMFNLRTDRSCTAVSFFRAFASNFKQATVIWLIELLYGVAMYFFYYIICIVQSQVLRLVLLAVFCMLFVVCGFLFLYAFPLASYFENTTANTLKNALIISMHHYRKSILAFALSMIPAIVLVLTLEWFLRLLFVWVLLAPALLAYWITGLLNPVFESYIPKDEE